MNTPTQQYVPGVCNIGPAEIAMRTRVGWMGTLAAVVLWAIFSYFNLAAGWFLILFFPASMAAAGFIQGFGHFCAGFGMRGLFNFGTEINKTDSVSQAEFRAKDRAKAIRIFVASGLIGIAVALTAFFVR